MAARIPNYRRQKRAQGDIAFVELNGQRFYLGRYNSPESKEKYHHLLGEWTAAGEQVPVKTEDLTVAELVLRFWKHAQEYYRKPDGSPTQEIHSFRYALRPLKKLYSHLPVMEFSPLKLKAVRQKMINKGWARNNINIMTGRVKRVFKWGVENELVPPDVFHGLQAVPGLRRGRSAAKESEPVQPVQQAHIDAIRPYVSRQVWALVQLQLHTAARQGELFKMRAIDIDMNGNVWTYQPTDHKTAYHGHQRTIYIGPNAQDIISQFLQGRPLDAYLFSPKDAMTEQAAQAPTHRRPDQKPGKRKTDRVLGDFYANGSYCRAITRACKIAKVPHWHPHQLRHSAATFIRREYGLEAAQIMLGHARADVTQLYAEINHEKALQLAAKIG